MRMRRTPHRVVNKKRLAAVIGITASVCVIAIICGFHFIGKAQQNEDTTEPEQVTVSTFASGVSIGGVDVSGMTIDEGRQALQPVVEQITQAGVVSFKLPDELDRTTASDPDETEDGESGEEEGGEEESTEEQAAAAKEYSLPLDQLGVSADVETALQQALEYSQQEADREVQVNQAIAQEGDESETQPFVAVPMDFSVERVWDEAAVKTKVEELAASETWRVEPESVSYEVRTTSDEGSMTTWSEMVKAEPKDGVEVDTEALAAAISEQIQNGTYEPFIAAAKVIPASEALEEVPEIRKMGSFTTEFQGSSDGRLYNIWKISDKLNGVVFSPGQEFSVNDHVGPRNEENGWAIAMGIENGVYTPQYGGGICQVSSTMYNACLYAELRPTARVPHTIMAKYTPPGRDATISTGSPDFKVINDYPRNLYMIIMCDVPSRSITVEIWGTIERDYTVEISSELVSETPVSSIEYVTDGSLGAYEISTVMSGQKGEYYEIYRTKKYEDGREETEKISSSSYPAKGAIYALGSGIPLPASGTSIDAVRAQAEQLKNENAQAEAEAEAAAQAEAEAAAQAEAEAAAQKEAEEAAQREAEEAAAQKEKEKQQQQEQEPEDVE